MPTGHVQSLIKYLYYDTLLSYGQWGAHDEEAATMRARTVSAITRMLVDHLCGNEDTRWDQLSSHLLFTPPVYTFLVHTFLVHTFLVHRWDLLELFARYETEHKLALRPSYVQTLLDLVKRRM